MRQQRYLVKVTTWFTDNPDLRKIKLSVWWAWSANWHRITVGLLFNRMLKSKHNFSIIPNNRYSNKCITIQNCFSHTSWYRIIFCKALVHKFWWQGCNYRRIHIKVLINISVTIKMQHCALAIQIHYTRPRKIIPFNNEGSVRRRFCHRRFI